jgi:hypothetical protein
LEEENNAKSLKKKRKKLKNEKHILNKLKKWMHIKSMLRELNLGKEFLK